MPDITLEIEDISPLPDDSFSWEKNIPYVFKGLGIVIEYLGGDTRTKVKGPGLLVSNIMPTAYGYILRTTDVHGEEIDMYLASEPDRQAPIYVIDQVDPTTGIFDEHKVMLGFENPQDAVDVYLDVFSDGSGKKRLGAITTFPNTSFLKWVGTEGYSLQPAAKYELDGVKTQIISGIQYPRVNSQTPPKPIDEAGGVIVDLPDLSKGPKLVTSVNENGGIDYTLFIFCAIDTEVWSNTIDTFCRTLDLASEKDTVHIRLSSPGGCVFTMGRVVSAIKSTKAHVITYAQGAVASAATTIWAAGHERHILPGAYFMQHMSSQLLSGKTSDIAAKSVFCVEYIKKQLQPLLDIGIFTEEEVSDMVEKSADIFVSGRKARERVESISKKVEE